MLSEATAIEMLRPDLEPLPERLRQLAVYRSYPVPWFVFWENGVPDFRIMDIAKHRRAIREKLCWVCGEKLGRFMTFVAGPMCGINRTSAEPPCHLDCAQYSARNCPFLSKPQMVRRENNLPADIQEAPGIGLSRNPGVVLLWITKGYELFGDGSGGVLLRMGAPERVEWWALGQPATRQQVAESVAGGFPALEAVAREQDEAQPGAGAVAELTRRRVAFEALYPKAVLTEASA